MKASTRMAFMILSFAIQSARADACSFAGASLFEPDRKKFVEHYVGEYQEELPAPVVKIVEVSRGRADPGSSCDDAGTLRLSLSLPKGTGYKLSEVGFYFRPLSGAISKEIFESIPLVGPIKNGEMEIFIAWLDGHPRQQKAIAGRVEVFAIANNLSIGPSTVFELNVPVGSAFHK